MATVTQDMFTSAEASVSVTFNDANGAISQVSWIVNSGALTVTIKKSATADIVVTRTASGSQPIPNGYNLTKSPKGDWRWQGDPAFEINWHS